MKTQIRTRIFMLGIIFSLAIYAVFFQTSSTKSTPEVVPAARTIKHPAPAIVPSVLDTLTKDTLLHQEQTIKKLDIRMYKRSMYMHRKPYVV